VVTTNTPRVLQSYGICRTLFAIQSRYLPKDVADPDIVEHMHRATMLGASRCCSPHGQREELVDEPSHRPPEGGG
jgi:hypothetical protein